VQSRCKCVPNEPIPTYGHNCPQTPECLFKLGDRQSEKKWRDGDQMAICNAMRGIDPGRGVIRHCRVSDGADAARPDWGSYSTWTEMFFADVSVSNRCVLPASCVGSDHKHESVWFLISPTSGTAASWQA
jgi:hypothetical protein